jgi:flagellar FliL protein
MGDEEKDDLAGPEEEEGGASEGEQAGGGGGPSKIIKILLYVAGGILLIVLVTGISYLVSKSVQESSYEKSQDIVSAPPPPALSSFELPPFAKTTADAEPHFMKITMSLAYKPNLELGAELGKRKDQMQHIINILLQSKKYEDLNTVSGQVALAEEIKAHVNTILAIGKIDEVYFKEFLVQ